VPLKPDLSRPPQLFEARGEVYMEKKDFELLREEALAAVRLSLGESTTRQDIEHILAELPPLLAPLLEQTAQCP